MRPRLWLASAESTQRRDSDAGVRAISACHGSLFAASLLASHLLGTYGMVAPGLVCAASAPIGWFLGRRAGVVAAFFAAPLPFQAALLLGIDTSLYANAGFGLGFVLIMLLGWGAGSAHDQLRCRRLSQQRAALSSDILQLVASSQPFADTLLAVARRIEEDLPGARASILLLDPMDFVLRHIAAPSLPTAYTSAIGGRSIGPCADSHGVAALSEGIVIVEDMQNDPAWSGLEQLTASNDLMACWSVPFFRQGTELLGRVAVYYAERRAPEDWELLLVQEAAKVVALVVEHDQSGRARAELEQQVQVAQRLEGLGLLAAGVAHDFNNLLVAVLGNADSLGAELEDAAQLDRVAEIKTGARRAAELADQMLTYAGERRLSRAPVDLGKLVEDSTKSLGSALPKHIALEFERTEGLAQADGNTEQLHQILRTLVVNAADAIGGVAGRIAIRTYEAVMSAADLAPLLLGGELEPGRYVALEVEDDGPGIAANALHRIFDPFFSTRGSGRGLGLATLFGIVRGHGGALGVVSTPDSGARFTVYLPARAERALSPEPAAAAAFRGEGLAVVVDDQPGVRRVASHYLERLGFCVEGVSSGEEAIERFAWSEGEVRLLLLDMSMPGMNGRDVLRALRPLPECTLVVLTTGFDSREAGDELSDIPMLHKPYDLMQLERLLAKESGRSASPGATGIEAAPAP